MDIKLASASAPNFRCVQKTPETSPFYTKPQAKTSNSSQMFGAEQRLTFYRCKPSASVYFTVSELKAHLQTIWEPNQFASFEITEVDLEAYFQLKRIFFSSCGKIYGKSELVKETEEQDPLQGKSEPDETFDFGIREEETASPDPEPEPFEDIPFSSSNESDDDFEEEKFLVTKPSYEAHVQELDTGSYKCRRCEKTATNISHLVNHIQTHMEKSTLCFICGKTVKTWRGLCPHEFQHKMPGGDSCDYSGDVNLQYICRHCDRLNFRSLLEYEDHQNMHTKERKYGCSCGATFRSYPNFSQHRKKLSCLVDGCKVPDYALEVFQKGPRKRNEKTYICDKCDKFKSNCLTNFKQHIALKHTERNLPCPECPKLFPTQRVLKTHFKRIHMERIKCEVCGKIVKKVSFASHMVSHENGRTEKEVVAKKKAKIKEAEHCFICRQTVSETSHFKKVAHCKKVKMWQEEYSIYKFACQHCRDEFAEYKEYIEHLLDKHGGNVSIVIEDHLRLQKMEEDDDFDEAGESD